MLPEGGPVTPGASWKRTGVVLASVLVLSAATCVVASFWAPPEARFWFRLLGATFLGMGLQTVRRLESLGYVVEDRVLDAADYGAATHRKRLFLIARRDGLPIAWPEPSHGPLRPLPYKTAGDCVDWAKPLPSIFGRKRMHRPATHRRIAEALKRHLFETQEPFLVQVNHGRDRNRSRSLAEPLPIVPTLVQTGYGERKGQRPRALDVHQPLGTIVAGAQKHALIGACLIKYYGTSKKGASLRAPLPTITAQGQHMALVAAFLEKHYGAADQPLPLSKAIARVLEEAKTGVVTVEIGGVRYAIVDIGLRMLSPRELARCQGFTDDYVLTGTQEQQVARIGNSVPPPLAAAIVRANVAPRPRLVPRPLRSRRRRKGQGTMSDEMKKTAAWTVGQEPTGRIALTLGGKAFYWPPTWEACMHSVTRVVKACLLFNEPPSPELLEAYKAAYPTARVPDAPEFLSGMLLGTAVAMWKQTGRPTHLLVDRLRELVEGDVPPPPSGAS